MVSQLQLVVGGKGEKGVVHAVSHPAVSTISAHSNPAEESPVTALQVSQDYLRIDTEVSTLWFLHCRNLLQVKEDSVMTFRLLEQNCLNSIHLAISTTRQELLFIFPPVHLVSSAGL